VLDGKPMFAYAYTNQDGAKYPKQRADKTRIVGAEKLSPGKHTIDFDFKYDGGGCPHGAPPRAAAADSGEGLIAELVRVEKEGERIASDELVAMLFLLLFAGHETTTHLISGSVYELVRNPGLRDWLEQDWSRAGLAVEEFLRFVSPVQFTKPRYVRRDVELGGVRLKKGDKIMAMLAAANLDPDANPHAEKLDLERRPNRHVAFGTGIHFCLGHQLARIEGSCALKALLRRWPKLALAVPEQEIRWRPRTGFRAIERLPVAVQPQLE
jgi:cytochrome P450